VLVMIWVYLGWLILLLGASVAFYHQSPEFLSTPFREIRLSDHLQERLRLEIMVRIARCCIRGEPPRRETDLARELSVPSSTVAQAVRELVSSGYLIKTADLEQPGFVLARTPEGISIPDLIMRLRRFEEDENGFRGVPAAPVVERVEQAVAMAIDAALGGITLRDLAEAGCEPLLASIDRMKRISQD
jgi:membrane protein